jgi:hypothetical protein
MQGSKSKVGVALAEAAQRGEDFDKLEKAARNALFGYAKMDIFGSPALEFGLWNPHGLNTAEAGKLYKSMMEHGIQRFSVENAIPVIVNKEWISVKHLGKTTQKDDWPDVKWTDIGRQFSTIKALGGRHRQYALTQIRDKLKIEKDRAWSKVNRVEKNGVENAMVRAEFKEKQEEYERSGGWLIAFYDIGESTITRSFADMR